MLVCSGPPWAVSGGSVRQGLMHTRFQPVPGVCAGCRLRMQPVNKNKRLRSRACTSPQPFVLAGPEPSGGVAAALASLDWMSQSEYTEIVQTKPTLPSPPKPCSRVNRYRCTPLTAVAKCLQCGHTINQTCMGKVRPAQENQNTATATAVGSPSAMLQAVFLLNRGRKGGPNHENSRTTTKTQNREEAKNQTGHWIEAA